MRTIFVTLLLAVVACARGKQDASTAPADPATATDDGGDAAATARPKPPPLDPALTATSVACGEATCVAPDKCVEYPTMGAQGPTIGRECAIPCEPSRSSTDCPDGRRCVPIPDGPGNVCR